MGLEILEDAPDVRTVIAAIGGGGLISGVGSAIKAPRPSRGARRGARDRGALCAVVARRRPAQIPRLAGLVRRRRRRQERDRRMWQRMRPVPTARSPSRSTRPREAMRLIAEKTRTIAEGRGRAVARRRADRRGGEGPVVCVVRAATSTSRNSPSLSPLRSRKSAVAANARNGWRADISNRSHFPFRGSSRTSGR